MPEKKEATFKVKLNQKGAVKSKSEIAFYARRLQRKRNYNGGLIEMVKSELELIIVFKKDVSEEKEQEILQSFGVKFRSGMDSSKGKIYFYSTGGKYILTFNDDDAKLDFMRKGYQFMLEIHQIYEPNWDIQKD